MEEELLLVRAESHSLAHDSEAVLDAMSLPSDIAHAELYSSVLELATPVCGNAGEALGMLAGLRRAAKAAGATAIGAGVHPTAEPGDAQMLGSDRYSYIRDLLGSAALRTPECALHVHVGMPDADTAIRAFNGMRGYVPLLEALAANSPFIFGADSSFASARGFQMRRYPRFEVPEAFADFEEYTAALEAVMAAGEVSDHSIVWWRLRLHPRLGTIEVRVMDSQSALPAVAGIAALTHGLVAAAVHEPDPATHAPRGALAESSYHAIRFGLDSRLWDGERVRPARELAAEAVARARPFAEELGSGGELEEIERIVMDGNGSDRQRAAFERGGAAELLRHLVAETDPG